MEVIDSSCKSCSPVDVLSSSTALASSKLASAVVVVDTSVGKLKLTSFSKSTRVGLEVGCTRLELGQGSKNSAKSWSTLDKVKQLPINEEKLC